MNRVLLLVGVLASAAVVVEAQESELARGASVLAPFKQDLMQALRDGLAQGPVEAIAACRVEAPEIAAALSEDGVRVGRASHRLRNPSNTAPEWAVSILDSYESDAADRAPVSVPLGDGRFGYAEPIIVQPLCVTCHGRNLAPELAFRISELYPADRAVGYEVGDLRGIFWAEIPR